MRVCIFICTSIFFWNTRIRTHICTYIYTYTYIRTHTCRYMYVCICVCVPVYICVPTYSHRHVYMYTHTKRTLRHTLPIHFTINLIRLWKAMIELTRVKPTKTRAQYLLSRNVCACRVCDPSQGDARTASKYIYRTASIDT